MLRYIKAFDLECMLNVALVVGIVSGQMHHLYDRGMQGGGGGFDFRYGGGWVIENCIFKIKKAFI